MKIMQTRFITMPLLVAAIHMLVGCNPLSTENSDKANNTNGPSSSSVLATVNGEAITQDDVDFMISRTFSGSEQLFFDERMQSKVLDSLVASAAMRQKILSTLSDEELHDIEQRTKAYRDELFIKEYLSQYASPEPVSAQMVNDYYKQYPEEFGGGESRVFEVIATSNKPTERQRDQILAAAPTIQNSVNWLEFVDKSDLGLQYKKTTMQPGLFDAALENAVKSAKLDKASNVVFIKGMPHFVRVLEINPLPAKPLNQVSAQIRKKLAASQLKKAVKSASETATKAAAVIKK